MEDASTILIVNKNPTCEICCEQYKAVEEFKQKLPLEAKTRTVNIILPTENKHHSYRCSQRNYYIYQLSKTTLKPDPSFDKYRNVFHYIHELGEENDWSIDECFREFGIILHAKEPDKDWHKFIPSHARARDERRWDWWHFNELPESRLKRLMKPRASELFYKWPLQGIARLIFCAWLYGQPTPLTQAYMKHNDYIRIKSVNNYIHEIGNEFSWNFDERVQEEALVRKTIKRLKACNNQVLHSIAHIKEEKLLGECCVCFEEKALKLIPCSNKHTGANICAGCLNQITSCPLCRSTLQ